MQGKNLGWFFKQDRLVRSAEMIKAGFDMVPATAQTRGQRRLAASPGALRQSRPQLVQSPTGQSACRQPARRRRRAIAHRRQDQATSRFIGSIIVRQVGSTFAAGHHVGVGKDFTLFALVDGKVKFHWRDRTKRQVSVVPWGTDTTCGVKLYS